MEMSGNSGSRALQTAPMVMELGRAGGATVVCVAIGHPSR